MSDIATDPRMLATMYRSRVFTAQRRREDAKHAEQKLQDFIEDRAFRSAPKPYEICGAEDSYHPRLPETDPAYDEGDLVPSCQCQLPKGHREELGYENHLEMTEDGRVWGAWS